MLSPRPPTPTKKHPSKLWWLLAVVILMVCILVQLPVSWLVQKFAPNTPYLQWVSGNLWQGSASWQTPQTGNTPPISGNLNWQWRPLQLLLGKLSADIEISIGQSRLAGQMNTGLMGFDSYQLQALSGRIHQDTLTSLVDWQLPDAPIQVNQLSIDYDKDKGFEQADGQLTWVGGQLGYPNAGQVLQITLPSMRADVSTKDTKNKDTKNNGANSTSGKALHLHLVDQESKTLGDFSIDKQAMLDISLTQRLLENMPSYNGSAPQDTPVVSIRQPLKSLGGGH